MFPPVVEQKHLSRNPFCLSRKSQRGQDFLLFSLVDLIFHEAFPLISLWEMPCDSRQKQGYGISDILALPTSRMFAGMAHVL